jgi:hypothetical protein
MFAFFLHPQTFIYAAYQTGEALDRFILAQHVGDAAEIQRTMVEVVEVTVSC